MMNCLQSYVRTCSSRSSILYPRNFRKWRLGSTSSVPYTYVQWKSFPCIMHTYSYSLYVLICTHMYLYVCTYMYLYVCRYVRTFKKLHRFFSCWSVTASDLVSQNPSNWSMFSASSNMSDLCRNSTSVVT